MTAASLTTGNFVYDEPGNGELAEWLVVGS